KSRSGSRKLSHCPRVGSGGGAFAAGAASVPPAAGASSAHAELAPTVRMMAMARAPHARRAILISMFRSLLRTCRAMLPFWYQAPCDHAQPAESQLLKLYPPAEDGGGQCVATRMPFFNWVG